MRTIAETVPERYRALVLASAGLGLRQGEACGLTVDRVDFLRRTVRIDRQLVTPPKGPTRFGPPKTPSSDRVVTLPETVGAVLAAHLARFEPGEHGLVFTSSTGAALRRSTWSDAFRSRCGRSRSTPRRMTSGITAPRCCFNAGCSVTAAQHFLGHRNASETLDTYSHLWPSDEGRIRAAIDAGLHAGEDQVRTDGVSGG